MGFYFDKETSVESKEVTTRAEICGKFYTFKTDNNVFSKKGLDFGTRTLLESIDIKNIGGDVLDFGCGYGPVGIYIASLTNSSVDMIDINERALKLAKSNASINKVDVNVFEIPNNAFIANPPVIKVLGLNTPSLILANVLLVSLT